MLTPLVHESQYLAALQRAKDGAEAFSTNLFAEPGRLRQWIDRRELDILEATGASLVLRKERRFLRIFHLAPDPGALANALARLPEAVPASLWVADLVGREDDLAPLVDVYLRCGFRAHRRLFRMTMPTPSSARGSGEAAEVAFAGPQDAPAVARFLEERLDPLAEQPPGPEDIAQACANREVLCCLHDGALAGVLVLAAAGFTMTLRYWFVDPRFHGQGIGSRLIRRFFQLSDSSRRIVLWVLEGADAIRKYEHYGFRMEALVDQVMVGNSREQ